MSEYKILDYVEFPLKSTHSETMTTCFVVYSTREEHVPNVIGVIENIFKEEKSYQVVLLGEQVKSGDSQYGQLLDYLNTSSFAVIILDGFRPNVLFEFGILTGLKKPCIVLLEKSATVDVLSYETESIKNKVNPKIDIDKHFSDVKDRYYVTYDKNNLKDLRLKLDEQYNKLRNDIERSVLGVMFPGLDIIEDELKECLLSLIELSVNTTLENYNELELRIAVEKIDRLAKKHKFDLSCNYYKNLSDIYGRLKKPAEALIYIDKSLSVDPTDIVALVDKAFLYADLSKEDLALLTIDEAIKIEPKLEFIWHNKGLLFERFQKKDEAMICYEKALQYDKSCSELNYNYSSLCYEKKQYTLALDSIKYALELKPCSDKYFLMESMIYFKLGQNEEALNAVKDSIAFNANNANAWYQFGKMSDSASDKLNYFNKSISIDPKKHSALCAKANVLYGLNKYSEADEIWIQVLELCKSANDCSTLFLNMGMSKYLNIKSSGTSELADIDNIRTYFDKALESASIGEKSCCHNNIGYMYLQTGYYHEAKLSFESAIACDDDDSQLPFYNLAVTHIKLGNIEIASGILLKLEDRLKINNCHCSCLIIIEYSPSSQFITKELFGNIDLLQETRKLMIYLN